MGWLSCVDDIMVSDELVTHTQSDWCTVTSLMRVGDKDIICGIIDVMVFYGIK